MQTIGQWIERLEEFEPCRNAIKWVRTQPDPQTLWNNCERGDWMLWLMGELAGGSRTKSRKKLVLAACECARLALPYVIKGEKGPLRTIETAEAWTRGEATLKNVRNVACATAAAADAAVYAAAAADAAVYAAAAAYVPGADYAAAAAYEAALVAGTDAAKIDCLRKCADIARKYYSEVPKL